MDHHPHVHAIVPGGGPSLHGDHWVSTKHPTQKNRRKPFLVDVEELGNEFQKQFVTGLRRLIHIGKLRLEEEFARLTHVEQREAWLDELQATSWNVFVEGPPNGRSEPTHVVKYLARYMSGGPIADHRLISDEETHVTFWARTKDKRNQSAPFTLRGPEFVRRWSMHILPKGYTRSRSYGGFHGSKRTDYLQRCRQLLEIQPIAEELPAEFQELREPSLPKCKRCKVEMACIESAPRPSWREIFTAAIYREPVYCPLLHIHFSVANAHSIGGYG